MALTARHSDNTKRNPSSTLPVRRFDDESDHAHRQLIGYIGLVIPVLLILVAIARDGVAQWLNLNSISAYYYTGAVAALVGMLVSLALYLFTYRGYKNKYSWADRTASITAAIAALGVAFFPTAAPAGAAPLSWWTASTGKLHYACAITLFSMFAVFALWLFRLRASNEPLTSEKKWRNRGFLICGILIVLNMIWAGVAGYNKQPIFWPESFALIAFSVSWLIKGYAYKTIADTARLFLGWKRDQ